MQGWNRCALSFEFIKIDGSPFFEILYSLFYLGMRSHKTDASFSTKLASSKASGGADTQTPETWTLKPAILD